MLECMSILDDFLGPLHQGIWEVIVPKKHVDGLLGPDWKESKVNLPSPETIASFRKGRYHAHETKSDYRVHIDLYDPVQHPVMHLIDDAPLLLMISGSVESLWVDAKNTRKMDSAELLREQRIAWQLIFLAGICLLILGGLIIARLFSVFDIFLAYGLPLAIIGFALFIIFQGIRMRPLNAVAKKNIIVGAIFIVLGLLAFLFPAFTVLLLILLIAIWPISSAIVSLKRVRKGKVATPDGFTKRLVIGVGSIILAVLSILFPVEVTMFILVLVAGIVIFIGAILMIKALGIRNALMAQSANTMSSG